MQFFADTGAAEHAYREAGFADTVVTQMADLVRPAIGLFPSDDPAMTSGLMGPSLLPTGAEHPMTSGGFPLTLMLRLDLSQVPPTWHSQPGQSLLLYCDLENADVAPAVSIVADTESLSEVTVPGEPSPWEFQPADVRTGITVPRAIDRTPMPWLDDASGEQLQALHSLADHPMATIFGWADEVFGDPRKRVAAFTGGSANDYSHFATVEGPVLLATFVARHSSTDDLPPKTLWHLMDD